jgi:hypothetical protein
MVLEEVLAVATGVGVGFGPGVAAGARPDAFFGCGQTADLGFELVPEGGAFALCWDTLGQGEGEGEGRCRRTILFEGARRCFLAADASYVFGDVVFGIEIGGCGADACNCACYGCWGSFVSSNTRIDWC